MKRFLIQILTFALLIAATLAAGEAIVRSLPNPYKVKDAIMTSASPGSIRKILLGNSHTYYGLVPSLLGPGTVNLGNVSQTLKYDRLLLDHYLPSVDSLQTVIMVVGYTSLFDTDIEQTDEWWLAINYRLYMHLGQHPALSRYNAELSHISVYSNKLAVAAGLTKSNLDCSPDGQGLSFPLSSRYDGWEDEGPVTARRHTAGLHPEAVNSNLAHIIHVDSICRSRGANLVLVTMPAWHTYRDAIDPARLSTFIFVTDSLSRVRGIPWLNYFSDPRFVADDFHDPDHLASDTGADRFTRILADTLSMILPRR